MPPVAAAGAAVGGWLAAATGSAVVGAIGAAVVEGAIVGAVIGAGTAAVTGEDILQGALKGAAVGGIASGVLSAGSMALSWASGGSIGTSAAGQLAAKGIDAATGAKIATDASAKTPGLLQTADSAANPGIFAPGTAPEVGKKAVEETAKKGGMFSGLSDSQAKVAAGVGEGLSMGLATVGGSMIQGKQAEEAARAQAKEEEARVNRNLPGEFEQRIVNITLPEHWKKYEDPLSKMGLTPQTVTS